MEIKETDINMMTFEDIMRYCVKYFSVDDILNEAACYEDSGKFSWEMRHGNSS